MEIFAAPAGFSVLEPNILLLAEREDFQLLCVRIFSEQTHRADPAVFIGWMGEQAAAEDARISCGRGRSMALDLYNKLKPGSL